jgi:DNA-binding XRE family transcriptional regulator
MSLRDIRKSHVGHLILASRQEAGLTQRALAKKLGFSTGQTVYAWENGRLLPSAKSWKKLCKALKGHLGQEKILDTLNYYLHNEAELKLVDWEKKLKW